MSERTFHVGEIAILVTPDGPLDNLDVLFFSRYARTEVTVNSDLIWDPCAIGFWVHEVEMYDGSHCIVTPRCLRKIPPKQDWKVLCKLNAVPQETSCA